MNKNPLTNRLPVAALFLLCAVPGLVRGQGASAPATLAVPHTTPTGAQPRKALSPADDFAGLEYTDEQKAKIDAIQKDVKSRADIVIKDKILTQDQKEAMLAGYQRTERSEIYRMLTPEQQAEVRKKIAARRTAEKEARLNRPSQAGPPLATPGAPK